MIERQKTITPVDVPEGEPHKSKDGQILFQAAVPLLFVEDVSRSIAYYEESLGFDLQWNIDCKFALVGRGGCILLLATAMPDSSPSWMWIEVDDVQALFEEFLIAGAVIVSPPNKLDAGTEMRVTDLDNNLLWFRAEPKPFALQGCFP